MIEQWLENAVGIVWNYPVVGLCLLAGVLFTVRLGFIQLRCFPHALALISGRYDHPDEEGELTHFQALSAALSGTVGLGNIAGVAIAISMGGPGAIFWMWIIAFFGMATKYVECSLGTMYREIHPGTGRFRGGPMYYITNGLGKRWWPMSVFFSICLMLGSFGAANMFQANQVALALSKHGAIPDWITGLGLAILVGLTTIGGIKRIGSVTSRIVPTMCFVYMAGAIFICILNVDKLPAAFATIFRDAFSGWAAAGGAVGIVIITGVRRAVFSNEAGLGTAPIAHAVVKTSYPIREGMVASIGPFIDTIVVCTATAMVIILAGNYGTEMYEPIHTVNISANTEMDLNQGWTITAKDVPPETDKLRHYREGDFVLAAAPSPTLQSSVLPPISVIRPQHQKMRNAREKDHHHVVDALRFSCFHGKGSYLAELIDTNGQSVAKLKVQSDGDAITYTGRTTGATKTLISISGCSGKEEWHSHLITFSDAFKKKVIKAGGTQNELRLKLTPVDATSPWFFDRVGAVQKLQGIALTTASFDKFLHGFGSLIITVSVILFCYSTMITWCYYGEVAAARVFGNWFGLPYKIMFVIAAYFGATLKLAPVLNFSDLMTGCMIIPNFLAMFLLSPIVIKATKEYFTKLRNGEIVPTNQQLK